MPASLLVVPLGKALRGIPHLGEEGKWLATPKRVCIALGKALRGIPHLGEEGKWLATPKRVCIAY